MGEENLHSPIHLHQTLTQNLQDESDADARLVAAAKNLQSQMSDESAADATMVEGVPCPLLQHASASDSNEIRDCKFSPCVSD